MKRNILFLVLLALTLSGCPPGANIDPDYPVNSIYFTNNTDDTICYYKKSSCNIIDTLLPESSPYFDIVTLSWILKSHSSKKYDWATDLPRFSQNDSFGDYIYFFNYDSIISIPWSEIVKRNIITKRIFVDSWGDLEKVNYQIAYP